MKDILIIGAKGVGRETALIIEDINFQKEEWNLLGFLDDNLDIQGKIINGYKVLGRLNFLKDYNKEVYVICAIANYNVKKRIVKELNKNRNIKYATLIHPTTKINKTASIGKGCIVYQNVSITANISIGDHVIISPNAGIGHDSIIDDYSSLLWNVNISGNVRLREGVLVGSGATVIQGLEVGEGSIIGAGSVVIRNVPSESTVVGVPTRLVTK